MPLIISNGTGGGLASATTTWVGGTVPLSTDSVQIVSGDTVEVDGNVIWGDATQTALVINNGGTLAMSTTVSSEIRVRGGVTQHGTLTDGSVATALPSTITTHIYWNEGQTQKLFRWRVEADASIILHGTNKHLRTRTTTTLPVNTTIFDVEDATGWEVGDIISVAHTERGMRGTRVVVPITVVVGNTITVGVALGNETRLAGAQVFNASQRLKVGHNLVANGSDLFLYHSDALTPATTRYLNQFETRNMLTGAGGHSPFSIFQNSQITNVAYVGNIRRVSCHNYLEAIQTTGISFRDCNQPYNPILEECVYVGIAGNRLARSTVKYLRCGWHVGGTYTTWGTSHALEFEDCWINGSALSLLGFGQASSVTLRECEFMCVYTQRGAKVSLTLTDCNWVGVHLLVESTQGVPNKLIRNTYDVGLVQDVETFTFGSKLKTSMLIADWQNNPKAQYFYNFEGSFKRDSVHFKTKVASIRAISRNQLQFPLELPKTIAGVAGSQINVSVELDIDASTTIQPVLEISNGVDIATVLVPLITGWQQVILALTPTITKPVEIKLIIQQGTLHIDDFFINNVEFDIGQDLFVGGTEISTVVDITDTSRTLTLTGLLVGSIVEIWDNEILDVGNNNTLLTTTTNSSTSFDFIHDGSTNDVRVQVIKDGYIEIIQDFELNATNQSFPIIQVLDTND